MGTEEEVRHSSSYAPPFSVIHGISYTHKNAIDLLQPVAPSDLIQI